MVYLFILFASTDGRRPHSHSSVSPHDNLQQHHQHQQPKRPSSGHSRDQHLSLSMQHERKSQHREVELSHSQPAHYLMSQAHERRIKLEKADETSKGTSTPGTELIAQVFEKDQQWSGGRKIKKEHEDSPGGFTTETVIDHIIQLSINQPPRRKLRQSLRVMWQAFLHHILSHSLLPLSRSIG